MEFNNGVVSVDRHFARFGSQSIAINKINTVDVRAHQPYGAGPPIIFGVVAIGLAWYGFANHLAGDYLIAIFFAGLAIWAWRRHQIREYSLFLNTSSSQARSYVTRDLEEITRLREAIEAAIMAFHDREVSVHHDVTLRRADEAEEPRVIDVTPYRAEPRRPRLPR